MATLILTTTQPIYFALSYGGDVYMADTLAVGNALATPLACVYDTDPNAFAGKAAGLDTAYNPLPDVGQWCNAGMIYGYAGGLVICRQTHQRTIYAPADTPALFIVYRPDASGILTWVMGESVLVGMQRTYNGITYTCLQAHVTQADWTPDRTPALWQVYTPPPPQNAPWGYPVVYKAGDLVTYSGHTYKCLQAHTSQAAWTPVAVPALWQLVK